MSPEVRTSTLHEIRAELKELPREELISVIQRLARFKKENKELINYLLFEAHDREGFLQNVRVEIDAALLDLRIDRYHLAKKTIRKALRITNKYIRFAGSPEVEAELLLHLCDTIRLSGIRLENSRVLTNLHKNILKKAADAIEGLHEDLRHDLHKRLANLQQG